ncbi:hypothetical protein [Chondrinema litorale]|nr:hypothetical protein [Chondrinema litorale]UZR96804.1 hypothetical protein OQ292_24200 [Chondrinema litorale]
MKEDAITQKIANKLKAWKASQKGQTDFYEYEKSRSGRALWKHG